MENIFSLMSFCRKTSYSRGKSKNRKIITKITFLRPPKGNFTGRGGGLSKHIRGAYSKHLSVVKSLLKIFSFSFPQYCWAVRLLCLRHNHWVAVRVAVDVPRKVTRRESKHI